MLWSDLLRPTAMMKCLFDKLKNSYQSPHGLAQDFFAITERTWSAGVSFSAMVTSY